MTKEEIRKYIKSVIPTDEKIKNESESICKKIIESKAFNDSPLVLSFMSMTDEVKVEKVNKACFDCKKTLALPKIIAGSNLMEYYTINESFKVSKGSFGIIEPEAKKENLISPQNLPYGTLILVPGRAFTKDGKRLGRGKGFYDLWLSKIPLAKKNRVHLAGVCLPQQIVEDIPLDEHDILMDSLFY